MIVNKVLNAGKIKMAKSAMKKQAGKKKTSMGRVIFLSSVWKQEITLTSFLGALSLAKKKLF